jgi:hypothetical protein
MKRVIERCPNCGVEHDDPKGGACEVCGTTLRFWCRVHSKEIGWLESAACPRCAAEAAAPTPPSRPVPPPRAPEPPPGPRRPAPPRTPPTPRVPDPTPPPPRRPAPPREEPVEEPFEEPVVIIRPGLPPRRMPRPWGGRDTGVVLREGAEDLAPYAVAGATFAVRMMLALFAVVRSVIFWGLLGAAGGFFFPGVVSGGNAQADPLWTAMFGGMIGGGAGLLFGAIRALRILFAQGPR